VSVTQKPTDFDDVNAKAAAYRSGLTSSTDLSLSPTTAQDAPSVRRDLLDGLSAEERKKYPLYEGLMAYFWNVMLRVARVSYDGNEQHNPGQPLHWARGKSKDQMDCMLRHAGEFDRNDFSDASENAGAAMCWRAWAVFEDYLERKYNLQPPVNARSDD